MNMPFGMNDPSLLPMMRAKAMMAPGMIPGPVPTAQLTPGFRPPGAGGAPGLMPQQQGGGQGMDPAAMAMMAMAMGKGGGNGRTAGDADLNNYGGTPTMTPGQDANGNPIMLPNPNQPALAGGGASPSFMSWLKGLF